MLEIRHPSNFPQPAIFITEMRMHENYNANLLDNDIAILKLESPIDLSGYAILVRPACY